MQLNGPRTEHEHASVNMKVLLLVFSLLLIGTLGYLVGSANKNTDSDDNSAPTTKGSTSTDETADWKTYTNSILLFSVKYPSVLTLEDNSEILKKDTDKQPLWITLSQPAGSKETYGINFRVIEGSMVYAQGLLSPGKTFISQAVGGEVGEISNTHQVGEEGVYGQAAFVTKGKYTYYFSVNNKSKVALESSQSLFQQFLKTVSFVN